MKIYGLKCLACSIALILAVIVSWNAACSDAPPVIFKTVADCTILKGLTAGDAAVIARAKARHNLFLQVARSWCNKLMEKQGQLSEEKRNAVAGLARGVLTMEVSSSRILISPKKKEVQIKAAIIYYNDEDFQRAKKLNARFEHLRRWMRSARREKELLDNFQKIERSRKRRPEDLMSIVRGLKAVELNEKALRIWPEEADWGKLSKVEDLLSQAIRLDGAYFGLHLNRGEVRAVELEVEKAVTDFELAIWLNPKCAEAYSMLAMIYAGWYDLPQIACCCAEKACKLGDCGALDFLRELGNCSSQGDNFVS